MSKIKTIAAVSLATIMATGPALAQQARIYAFDSHANYCPAGLQPVTINGVICCGTPNQSISYQHAKKHPQPKVHRHIRRVSYSDPCPAGTKGC